MSDDEIVEILDVNASPSGNNDICQLCSLNLNGLSVAERGDHYREHTISGRSTALRSKRGKPTPASVASTSQRKTTPMKCGKNAKNVAEAGVFWYPTQAQAPPDNYTPGVLSILKEALKQSVKKKATKRAVLCYERTPHILRETFDMSWGCGHVDFLDFGDWADWFDRGVARYRNFLMTCAALMDQQIQNVYFPHLDSPLPPGVRNLQQWIQDAWEHGYDEVGARELGRLVETNKKIGTSDLYVAFTSRKIPCVLVDFDIKESPKGFDTLIDWVVNYFTEKPEGDVNQVLRGMSPVVATQKMPVIMQFNGHSVTIVGYELGKNDKYNLLVFDPSSKIPEGIRQAARNVSTSARWVSSSSLSPSKGKRRERSNSPTPRKRSRRDPEDIVSIESDDDKRDDARRALDPKCTVDPDKVIKTFRLGAKYKKKQECQLLYFTLGDPLTDQEQEDRKVVFAEC